MALSLIASRTTGEIRCVAVDAAAHIVARPGSPWIVVCSEPEQEPQSPGSSSADGSSFEPLGGTVTQGAQALCYDPLEFEPFVRKGEAQLTMLVDHSTLSRRNMPRKSAAKAELKVLLARDLPSRGIVRIPFPAVETWNKTTMRRAIGLMAARLPGGPYTPREVYVSIHEYGRPDARRHDVQVSASSESEFFVELKLAIGVCPAMFWWDYTGTLARLDEMILAEARAAAQKRQQASRAADGDDADPELNWIERLARKHLHGREDEL